MNRTYENLRKLIEAGRYEYEDMLSKLDLFLTMGRLGFDEYLGLTGMMPEPELPEGPEVSMDLPTVEEESETVE